MIGTTSKQKKNTNVWMDMKSIKALERILGTRQAGAPGVVMLAEWPQRKSCIIGNLGKCTCLQKLDV